jgi:hypothetical protein
LAAASAVVGSAATASGVVVSVATVSGVVISTDLAVFDVVSNSANAHSSGLVSMLSDSHSGLDLALAPFRPSGGAAGEEAGGAASTEAIQEAGITRGSTAIMLLRFNILRLQHRPLW